MPPPEDVRQTRICPKRRFAINRRFGAGADGREFPSVDEQVVSNGRTVLRHRRREFRHRYLVYILYIRQSWFNLGASANANQVLES